MGLISAGAFGCLSGSIHEPRLGPWSAKLELDLDEERDEVGPAAGSPITLSFFDDDSADRIDFVGTVERGQTYSGRWVGFVMGGGGGLRRLVDAKYYTQVQAKSVVDDLLRVSGDTLDAEETDAALLSQILERWARTRGEVRSALHTLATELGAIWRVGRDGLLLIRKTEAYPTIAFESDEISREPHQSTSTIAPTDLPLVRPAVTFNGQRVADVTTSWTGSSLRQTIIYEDPDGEAGTRPRGAAAQFAAAMRRSSEVAINYSQMYPATVVKQAGNELEVNPDDPRIRGGGITRVPMRHGIPGLVVQVKVGQRVNVFFEEGKPNKPAAALWPDGSSVQALTLTAGTELNIVAPTVNIDGDLLVTGEVTAMAAAPATKVSLSKHPHAHPFGPTDKPIAGI